MNNFVANCLDLGRRNESLVAANNGFISVGHEYPTCNPWNYEGVQFLLRPQRFFQVFDPKDCVSDGQIYMAHQYGAIWRTVLTEEEFVKEETDG